MPYVDGPPWTVGQNCNVSFTHPTVNAGMARGFYAKPDTFRVLMPRVVYRTPNIATVPAFTTAQLPAYARMLEMVIECRDAHQHADGAYSSQAASQWHGALWAYLSQGATDVTLRDPGNFTWTVRIYEVEDRLVGSAYFASTHEVRTVWVERT